MKMKTFSSSIHNLMNALEKKKKTVFQYGTKQYLGGGLRLDTWCTMPFVLTKVICISLAWIFLPGSHNFLKS